MYRTLKKSLLLSSAALALGLGPVACVDDIPDYNSPGLETFLENPTPGAVNTLATGLLISSRTGVGAQNGYVGILGVVGREAYILDSADTRYVTELMSDSLDPGSPAFGGNMWTNPYASIRNGYLLLGALDNPKLGGFSNEEKEAMRGFAKTIMAVDYLVLSNTRDTNGVALDVNRPLGSELAPLVTSKEEQLAFIAGLLDQAQAHLQAAGEASFTFPLGEGFEGFDAPATFLTANRALKARVEAYRGNGQGILDAVAASFLPADTSGLTRADLATGVYYAFGSGPGDTANGLLSPNIYVHPSILTGADTKTGGGVDDRVSAKTTKAAKENVYSGLTGTHAFTLYRNGDANVPIIRLEELLLLRAEGYWRTGQLAKAADDLNQVRTLSGGLSARGDLTDANFKAALFKERTYSLLFEGGHRWIDARRFDLLSTLPIDRTGDGIPRAFPVPTAEMDARK